MLSIAIARDNLNWILLIEIISYIIHKIQFCKISLIRVKFIIKIQYLIYIIIAIIKPECEKRKINKLQN